MLVLTRKPDAGDQSKITVGADIEITVIKVSGDQVRIGITAPPGIVIDRKEIWLDKAKTEDKA